MDFNIGGSGSGRPFRRGRAAPFGSPHRTGCGVNPAKYPEHGRISARRAPGHCPQESPTPTILIGKKSYLLKDSDPENCTGILLFRIRYTLVGLAHPEGLKKKKYVFPPLYNINLYFKFIILFLDRVFKLYRV